MLLNTVNSFKCFMLKSFSCDNFIYRLHYRWTVLLLLVFCFIITCKTFFGNSISCVGVDTLPQRYVEMKCSADIFNLRNKLNPDDRSAWLKANRRYHSYYMWVNLFFLVQAFIFYLPHLLWISYDRGYTGKLTSRARKYPSCEEKHVHQLELRDIAEYLLATKGKHTLYTTMYIIFEAGNFAVASLQTLWLVNFFGVAGLAEDLPAEIDTWSEFWDFYFPEFGFCELRKLTPAVDVKFYTTCLLPLDALYVKMFLILLVWYVLLTFLSGMVLVYRIALLMPSFRKTSVTFWAPLVDPSTMKDLLRESYSDWFFLSRLQKTISDTDFAQLVREVSFMSSYNILDKKEADDNRSSLSNKNKSLNDSSSNVQYRVASPHGISAL